MNRNKLHLGAPPRRTGGFSLVELMVAIAIGLVLTIGVISLMMSTSRTHAELSKNSRQIENGRAAVDFLATEIRHAGFYGEFVPTLPLPGALPDPCTAPNATTLSALREAMALPIQGYDGLTSTIPACITDAGHVAGTDVLVLRRAATFDTALTALDPARLYLQGAPTTWRLDFGGAANFPLTDRNANPVPVRAYRTDIYFVGLVNGAPALRRMELGGDILTIADGIENLQLDFGIDRDGDGAPNAGAAGNDAYVALPADMQAWQNVVAVRVHVLARNPEMSPGYVDDKTYVLGITAANAALTIAPFKDAFRRHVYHSVARATNISGRRE